MDSKKAEALLKKYWEDNASLDEEKELKTHFLHLTESADPDHAYFNYLNEKSAENPLGDAFDEEILRQIEPGKRIGKQKNNKLKYFYMAASLALVISLSIIFKNEINKQSQPIQVAEIDTYDDPEKAFEETKRALQLISSKLNQSAEYASEFSKFEKSQNTLKQN